MLNSHYFRDRASREWVTDVILFLLATVQRHVMWLCAITDLSDAVLWEADLSDANLNRANLSGAKLSVSGVKRSHAVLDNADLSDADLSGAAGITNEELEQQAASLKEATMPDGQKYEDWLKSKGREENGW